MVRSRQVEGEARRRLEQAGVRPTAQRVAVLGELVRERHDATAQELHERLRRRRRPAGLATVYRTLRLLADASVVETFAHHPGEVCYRLCGEEHHHHLVCAGCHKVVELQECDLEPWLERVAGAHGFEQLDHRLEVTGLCADCRSAPFGRPAIMDRL